MKKIDTSRNPQRIRAMFSAIASRYDRGNHVLSFNIDRLWRRKTARKLAATRPRRVLDVCCGTADLAMACARKLAGPARVYGCDFALPMLQIGQQKIAKASVGSLPLAAADTMALPFADDAFDAVTVAFGLRNVVDHAGGLREMARTLRPGGTAWILEFSMPPHPVVRCVYKFYFRHVLPLMAYLSTGSKEYAYLPASVAEFPPPETLKRLMLENGFHKVHYEYMTFGIVTLHIGFK